jgi:hypothetical protein
MYTINESTARIAHEMRSFSDYQPGSATAGYNAQVDEAAQILETVKAKCATEAQRDRAEYLFDRYAATLAEAINRDNEIGTRCPSVMISGAGNFPTAKKAKQVAAWDANRETFDRAEHYLQLLRTAHTQPIKSNDPEATEALTAKLEGLKAEHAAMKAVNAYYRKNGTLDGCPELTPAARKAIEGMWARGWYVGVPYPTYTLANSLANVKRTEQRLNGLKAAQVAAPAEEEHDGITYREDTEQMRVQLIFDGKPAEDVRAILKKWAFRWSPRNSAWQRQLTDNGKRAARRAMEEIEALKA